MKTNLSAEYAHNSDWYRGHFIFQFTSLERALEEYLMNKFVVHGDIYAKTEFLEVILDRLTFEAKRTAVRTLLEKQAVNAGFVKTRNNSYPNSKLFDEIRTLNDQRVYFAHYISVIPSSENDSVIGLYSARDKAKILWYSKEKYDNWIKRIQVARDKVLNFTV